MVRNAVDFSSRATMGVWREWDALQESATGVGS